MALWRSGACFLYVSPRVRDELRPALTGGRRTQDRSSRDTMEYTSGAFRWLNGTPSSCPLCAAEGPRILRYRHRPDSREKP